MNAYCAHCGTPLTGPVCPRCGAPGYPAGPAGPSGPAAAPAPRDHTRTHKLVTAIALAVTLVAGGAAVGIGYVHFRSHPSAAPAQVSLDSAKAGSATGSATGSTGAAPLGANRLTADWAALPHPALGCPAPVAPEAVDTRYADLNGDGAAEALVTVDCAVSTGHSPAVVEIYDGASPGTAPRRLATLLTGADNLSIATMNVTGRTVVLTENGWSPNAPSATPDLHYTESFTWNGGTFASAGRQLTALDTAPRSPTTVTVPAEPLVSSSLGAQARADRCVRSLTDILSEVVDGRITEAEGESRIPHQAARELLDQAVSDVAGMGGGDGVVDEAAYNEFHAYCQNKYGLPA